LLVYLAHGVSPFDWLFSNPAEAGLQPQRLKHWRAFAFSAYDRKLKPPAMQVVVNPIRMETYFLVLTRSGLP
jgi:hypothetical protein